MISPIHVSRIYIPPTADPTKSRIREDYGDVKRRADSLAIEGQFQAILTRPLDREEFPDAPDATDLVVVDGATRLLATHVLVATDRTIKGLEPGFIYAMTRDDLSDVDAQVAEFKANEERKSFTWQERVKFIGRLHAQMSLAKGEVWQTMHTGMLLGLTTRTIQHALFLTRHPEVWEDPKVQNADTFRTAIKQAQISLELLKRKKAAAHPAPAPATAKVKVLSDADVADAGGEDEPDTSETPAFDATKAALLAGALVRLGDCREWIAKFPDSSQDFCHWDPPYGSDQEGGANVTFERIDDTWATASSLMQDMLPEIHRVLRPGHWLAIWLNIERYDWLRKTLNGHEATRDVNERVLCRHCGEDWNSDAVLREPCNDDRPCFWVNPIPFTWHKRNRNADGHEIKRFALNQTEHFLLAAALKDGADPILPLSRSKRSQSNVLPYDVVPDAERRHIMHKPVPLLTHVLDIISLPGERGIDPCCGSGSSLEAGLSSGRAMAGCELSESYRTGAVDAVRAHLEQGAWTLYRK